MEINQRVFKAPSIPKLGKQTVASSAIRGASKPQIKLKKSTFSFIKPVQSSVDTEKISQPIVNQGIAIEKELIETNRILVEIQKQLSLDFGYRITEEKKELAAEKKRISAAKVADKEARIEKGGKGVLGKTFDKVVAPFKSIFQKLIDFFSIILTGILLNSAFEWLKDKNNQKKLTEFFDFLKEYWQELLIIFAAYKLAKLVGVVSGIALKLKGILKWFRAFAFPKKPSTSTPTRPTPPSISPSSLSRSNASFARFIQGQSNIGDRLRLLRRGNIGLSGLFTKGGFNEAGALKGQELKLPKLPQLPKFQMPGGANIPQLPKGVNLGNLLRILAALEGTRRFKEGDIAGGALSFGSMAPIAGLPIFGIDLLRNMVGKDYFDKIYGQALSGEIGLSDKEIERRQRGSALQRSLTTPSLPLLYSEGGTVGKGDKGIKGVDNVPAFTTTGKKLLFREGEEIVKVPEAMNFRPLLKDVNNNGARLWAAFSQGVKDQTFANRDQLELNRNFGDVVKEFKDFVDSEIQKSKKKNKPKTNPRSTPTPTPRTQPRTGSGSSAGVGRASAESSGTRTSTPEFNAPVSPQTSSILDKIWNRAPGTTASMIQAQKNGAMDPGGTPAQSPSSGPQQLPVTPASTSDDLSKMGIEQLKKMLDPTKNARSVPGLFNHISGVREQNKNLSGSALERKVLEETVRFIRNANLQSVLPNREGLTRKSNSQEGQTAFINLPPDKSILPPPPKPSGQVKPKPATAVPEIPGSKSFYAEFARLYGIEGHPAFGQ